MEQQVICICGHAPGAHNTTAEWAPKGCYAKIGKRYPSDQTGKLCECVRYTSKIVQIQETDKSDG